ncbi:hypothetical protein [Microbacterium sp.]|uniref:hypothetical protein n=1 Tax=Microbacterium sp. TaxID=51671 RepID=UPI003241E558
MTDPRYARWRAYAESNIATGSGSVPFLSSAATVELLDVLARTEAKLDAVRAAMAPEATVAAMAARGFGPTSDGPLDFPYLAAFADYSVERTATIRKALA